MGELHPDTAEVKAIVAVEDAVIRNLRITECYAQLSAAMRAQVGEGANWCTFATWASRQAGCTIRGEDLGDRLSDLARGGWTLRHPVRSSVARPAAARPFQSTDKAGPNCPGDPQPLRRVRARE